MFTILAGLVLSHFLCDYPLQGDFLARGKNHTAPLPGVPWGWCLIAHAFIHAGGVYIVTGSLYLAFAELLFHALIDYIKCNGDLSFNQDQVLHLVCKLAWFVLFITGFTGGL